MGCGLDEAPPSWRAEDGSAQLLGLRGPALVEPPSRSGSGSISFPSLMIMMQLFPPQVTGGALRFRYSCGTAASGSLTIGSPPVSDGQWHRVLLEVNSSALRLTLDQQRSSSVALTEPCRMLPSHGALLFASGSTPEEPQRPPGFLGCLEGLAFNGEPIRVGDVGDWTGPGRRRVFGVYRCCSPAGACDRNPCQNGGACQEDASGGERPPSRLCSVPQTQNRTSISDPLRVQTSSGAGARGGRSSRLDLSCCLGGAGLDGPGVSHAWVCLFRSTGPRCRCAGLFHGARCELPDNPCASEPCARGRVCVPKAQGYMCNCSLDAAHAR